MWIILRCYSYASNIVQTYQQAISAFLIGAKSLRRECLSWVSPVSGGPDVMYFINYTSTAPFSRALVMIDMLAVSGQSQKTSNPKTSVIARI